MDQAIKLSWGNVKDERPRPLAWRAFFERIPWKASQFLGEIPTAVPTASAVATSWFWSERNSILHTSPTAWRRRSHLQEEWTISFEFSGSYWTWMWQASCTWQLESTVRWSSIKLFADWIPDTPAHLCVSEGPFSCGVSIQLVASFLIYIVVRDHARFGC